MRIARTAVLAAAGFALAVSAGSALAQGRTRVSTSGEGLRAFDMNCAACHVQRDATGADPRAPKIETLQSLTPERIYDAMTSGVMRVQAAALSDFDRREIATFLTGRSVGAEAAGASAMPNRCKATPAIGAGPAWNGWGADAANTRAQTAREAGLTAKDLPRLKLKWAFGVPGAIQMFSQPTVSGGWLFVGSDTGQVYALDAGTGCVHWSFLAGAAVRTAPLVVAGARPMVIVGDLRAKLYALDGLTGRQLWSTAIDDQLLSRIVAAPAYANGRLYVPIASGEEGAAGLERYECCRHRGSVSAVDAATGRVLWKTYTTEEARPVAAGPNGVRRWGPAGGGIWSTPTVDPGRGRLYVATGNAYAGPASPLTDAVVALDLASGTLVWAHQDRPNDVWTTACFTRGPSCPADAGPDYDFATPVVLQKTAQGRDLLVAGNKGGVVVALDPADGKLVWRRPLAARPPTSSGDITYGGVVEAGTAYFPLQLTAALVALDLSTGATRWTHDTHPDPGGRTRLGPGAALTGVPGALLAGGWDGTLRAYATADGSELWRFDTARSFQTVNGVAAKGGSMGAPGATVAGGMVFVGSGYIGTSDGQPGNVLLAFGL